MWTAHENESTAVKGSILAAIVAAEYRPAQLLDKLETCGVSEQLLKQGLADLISSNEVELTASAILRKR